MTNRKANRKPKPVSKASWAEALKADGIGLDQEDQHCSVATDAHATAQQFAGAPGYLSMGVYPVSAKPKRKSECVRS